MYAERGVWIPRRCGGVVSACGDALSPARRGALKGRTRRSATLSGFGVALAHVFAFRAPDLSVSRAAAAAAAGRAAAVRLGLHPGLAWPRGADHLAGGVGRRVRGAAV